MKLLNKANILAICISVFFLPISLNLNNIFLFVFISINILLFFLEDREQKTKKLKQNKKLLLLVSLPFWLNCLGLIYTDELNLGIDYTIRALPFLLIPTVAIINPNVLKANHKKAGYALVFGCLFVAFWSWSFSIQSIIAEGRPFKDLFGPLYSHHNLLKHLDMHATYLSIFIYTAIGFLVIEINNVTKVKKYLFIILISVLTAFLFHLLSRTAIFYFLITAFGYLVYLKQWKVILGLFLVLFTVFYVVYNMPNNYLRDRIFNNLNFLEKKTQFSKKDDRFDRLSASYKIFKDRPIIGYGTAAESKHRQQIFKENKDWVAYNENYNSHNQFFEYLSTFGLLGGLFYILFFGNLFYITIKNKQLFILFLLSGLFLGCITESIFERSWGVIYASLIIGLLISFTNENKTGTN
jgi:O-antigen ligase